MLRQILASTTLALLPAAVLAAGLTSRSYVQNGLVLQLDGIENAGRGIHDPTAAVWKDLSGHGADGTLKCLSGGVSNCWYDTYYSVRAAEKNWVHGQSAAFQKAINSLSATMDMCYTPKSQHCGCWVGKTTRHMATWDAAANTLYVYARHNNITMDGGNHMPRPNNANQTFAIRLNTTCSVFTNAVAIMADRPVSGTSDGAPDYYIGVNPLYTSVDDPSGTAYNGSTTLMYSLRLYDRPLSDAELAFNTEVDNIRFRGKELGDRKVLAIGAKPASFGKSSPALGSTFVSGSSVSLSMDAGAIRYEDGVEAVPVSEGVRATFAGAEIIIDGAAAITNENAAFSLELGTENSVTWLLKSVQYRVIVNGTNDVSVSINGGESAHSVTNWYDAGSVVTVTSESALGNRFKQWSVDVPGVANQTENIASFTVNSPMTVTAEYDIFFVDMGSENYPVASSDSADVGIESRRKESDESDWFLLDSFSTYLMLMLK